MKTKLIWILLLLCSPVQWAVASGYTAYSKLPLIEQPQISPDGNMIAAILNLEEGPQVVAMPFGTVEYKALAQLKKARDRVDGISWSGNKYLIISTSYPEFLNGAYFRVSRLYSIDVTTGQTNLIDNKRFEKYKGYRYQSYVLTSVLKDEPNHILVATYDEKDRAYTVFKVDLQDGSFDKELINRYKIDWWMADRQGLVRLGIQSEKKDKEIYRTTWYRPDAKSEMQKLYTRVLGKEHTFNVVGLDTAGTKAYVISDRETGRESLWLYDIIKGEFETLLFSHEKFDLSGTLSNSQGEMIGVYYYDDFLRTWYFDEHDAEQTKMVANLLPGMESTIVSQSQDKTRLLAYSVNDDKVPRYYFVDLVIKKAGLWLSQYPQLAKAPMAKVESYQFKASDGALISGYLTLPKDVKYPPLIVHPHGGPHSRDMKYFNPEVQYFISKGYAVLQVNFRGSEGFGSDFESAGYFQWGKRMQQDVYDAMDWVVASGRVAKDKACIVGGSYGGYVALTAAFQQPNRFECVISVAGISDLREMVVDEARQDSYISNIVDTDDSAAMQALDLVSATYNIDKITAPMLLIHGTKDTQVNYEQSADFYSKAKKNKNIKYVEIKDGTHYFDDNESRQRYFAEMDQFLTQYLQ